MINIWNDPRSLFNGTHFSSCEYSKSLEGDCGRDRVRRCHPLMPFQEGLEGDHGGGV